MQLVSKRQSYSLVCVLLGMAVFAGELAAADFHYDFSKGEMYIWDVSGTYDGSDLADGGEITITQDSKGKLSGGGLASYTVDLKNGDTLDIVWSYTVRGSVTQSRGVTRVKITVNAQGTAYAVWHEEKIRATFVSQGYVDPERRVMIFTQKYTTPWGKETYDGWEVALPEGMDGSFSLDIDIWSTAKADKLMASGQLRLRPSDDNPDTYSFSGTGSFNAKKNTYRLTLSSTDKSERNSLKLDINGDSENLLTKFSGTVLGQRLKAP